MASPNQNKPQPPELVVPRYIADTQNLQADTQISELHNQPIFRLDIYRRILDRLLAPLLTGETKEERFSECRAYAKMLELKENIKKSPVPESPKL